MFEDKGGTQAMRAQIVLREQILNGELPPGMRLMEVPLAERLGISRTPVRDALARLAEEGLLERARAGGFLVRTFSFGDVVDAIELRGVLEGTAARLAAERGAEPARLAALGDVVARLETAFGRAAVSVDFALYARENAAFHRQLWTLSGARLVAGEVERAARLPFASPSAFVEHRTGDPGFLRSLYAAQAQHVALVEAIAAREGARAEAIAREHARTARRNFEAAMATDRSLLGSVPALALVRG